MIRGGEGTRHRLVLLIGLAKMSVAKSVWLEESQILRIAQAAGAVR